MHRTIVDKVINKKIRIWYNSPPLIKQRAIIKIERLQAKNQKKQYPILDAFCRSDREALRFCALAKRAKRATNNA